MPFNLTPRLRRAILSWSRLWPNLFATRCNWASMRSSGWRIRPSNWRISCRQVPGRWLKWLPNSMRLSRGLSIRRYKHLLRTIFQGETLARFQRAPAAKKLHHAYIGGLIEHTLSIVGMAEKAASHYPLIDRDMLIAGALLHDLAKIEEFDFARPPFGYTDRGRLVGHLVLGVELMRKAVDQVEGISAEQMDQTDAHRSQSPWPVWFWFPGPADDPRGHPASSSRRYGRQDELYGRDCARR